LIVLSSTAIKSREVRGELRLALDEDKPVVPVLFQACRIPRQLRFIQYVDYSEREPDDAATLGLVLKALGVTAVPQAEAAPRPAPRSAGEVGTPLVVVGPPPSQPTESAHDRLPFEPEMILIPAGEFLMGSDSKKDKQTEVDEQPQHTLSLTDYYLARTLVTNAQYAAFVRKSDYEICPDHWRNGKPPAGQEDHPVVYVSWMDAMAYCKWLSRVTGWSYTLPSEVEWEKGARGTDGRVYPWGNQWDAARCNSEEGGRRDTTPVGAYPEGTSPYGLLDMAGNVWEWTRSDYREYSYNPTDGGEDLKARGPRVLRGGVFSSATARVRCAARYKSYPYLRDYRYGFRVVRPSAEKAEG
jgi:formylglycine-generating enzyme required for sulfatase activity